MSHRNSKKSNRIGQSIQKHRAQRNSPFEAEAIAAMDREYRSKLPNHSAPLAQNTTAPASPSETSSIRSKIASAVPCPISVPLVLSDLSVLSPDSPSEISNLKSPSDSTPASAPSTHNSPLSPTEIAAARDLIASKPATKAMHKLQHILDNHDFDYLNPNDVAQLSALMVVYAQLQNSSAVERISESLDQVGAGYKREPLTRELTKVLSIQDRALARAQREKAAKERDQRRIEREAKREQAQAAKQARDERLFNQREDHLIRQEKIAALKYETELLRQTNSQRKQADKHTKSQGATDSSSALSTQHLGLSSQGANPRAL